MKKLKLQNKGYKLLVANYKEWLDILGYAESTVYQLPNHLQEFFYYAECHGHHNLQKLTTQTVKDYYKELQQRSNDRQDGGLSKSYLNKHQQALKKFSEYLKQHNVQTRFNVHLKNEVNPTEEKLNIATQSEIQQLFKATNYSHKKAKYRLRDRAILVVLYSCGLRRNEAVSLDIGDLNFDKERIHVRKGKNYKERFVPINRKNAEILQDYLYESRIEFSRETTGEALFLNQVGNRLQGMSFANRLQAIVKATENPALIAKRLTPHSLRHSIATHLLAKEVPIENIKTFLGHSSLESTQIYTHLLKTVEDENL
ncbi:tyrosine-type recombinase/integrase [Kordia sp.]|uniref:tyrosine-type recombinase/integrase n=1 Tax=Kordia sp. TaxID=1965332 RepID=UPI0025C6F04D|nr:tyrosine-type recombinase/integrase [Kordia sp.]MCH2197110.1 tyrosine-type recombinase/integrase [Kordia sp.]